MFRRFFDLVRAFREQSRALERVRAQRRELERLNAELDAMGSMNEDAERVLGDLTRMTREGMDASKVAVGEVDRRTTEMTDRLAEASTRHAKETLETLERAARVVGEAQAAAFAREMGREKKGEE